MSASKPANPVPAETVLAHVRNACMALPEVSERPSHGSPTWFVRDKKTIAMFVDNHHGDGHLGIWCAAPPGVQEVLVETEPERFFRPPYVGHRGWIGVDLAVDPDWDEVREILVDAYRCVAPKTVLRQLDDGHSTRRASTRARTAAATVAGDWTAE